MEMDAVQRKEDIKKFKKRQEVTEEGQKEDKTRAIIRRLKWM